MYYHGKTFNSQLSSFNSQRGQVLLIVVLVMVVSLTVGLSVASRSIVNLRTSTEEENSQRAFSAAEAGIEKALSTGAGITAAQDLGNNAVIKTVNIGQVSGTEFVLNGGNMVEKDQGIDVGLSQDYPSYTNPQDVTNLIIYWGSPTDDCASSSPPAAIELIILSGTTRSPESTRHVFDPCSRGNNFSPADTGSYIISGKTFKYRTPLSGGNEIGEIEDGLIARVVPLYASTPIGVSSDVSLPLQGKVIQSTGASGGTERKITYFAGYPQLPVEFFQYILFSP